MGLGVHGGGLGVARFLVDQGADVTITDMRGPDLLKPSLDALAGLPIRYVLGEHREADFRSADLVIRNPGVPRESPYLQIARAAGAAIEMEMTLFFRLCPGPILGITGTKGKTTTTLLAGAMLREQYPDTVVAGNLRVSALEALPRITAGTPVVLELSSWQLEGLGEAQLSPQYACVTNISPDHLDRYGSMEAYAEAKKHIFRWQGADGIVVLNRADAEVASWVVQIPGEVVWFGNSTIKVPAVASGWVAAARQALWWSDERVGPAGADLNWPERICGFEEILLPGRHNITNVAAATALAKSFGVSTEHIHAAISKFAGVPHRLELVRELDGVRYVNDTTATAPEAVIAALRSFDTPIVLICGGADKNLPFDEMAQAIAQRAKAVVLLKGTATPKLEAQLRIENEKLRISPNQSTETFAILNSQFS
ncbi:MAG TPA: UDP-N-acetylmuramoyl-L-alanine--D-glutamate ligase, partial [Roseiflexaceae bacterium]|nr:UDP-N-acetylmuramoyl-L-alanine--D-glutamate ligase [Roseiflexaceae bacterium]